MGTGSFPGVKYGRGVTLTTHPLVPWSWKSRAIPLPTLWATTGPVTGSLYIYHHYIEVSVAVCPVPYKKVYSVRGFGIKVKTYIELLVVTVLSIRF